MSAISTPLPTPTDNYETQIDTASVSASALSFDVTDANADTNLPAEFIGVLYQKDADGEVVAGSVEYIHVTGVSGQTISLTDINDRGLTGSDNGAQAYSQNDYFGIWVTSYYYDSLKSVIGNATQTLDEDDMASDSATALATQQSIKAYVDAGDTAITGVDRCQAYTTSYSLASASEVAIPLDAESYDTNTMHDNVTNNEDITVKTTGNYLVTANVSCTASLSDGHRFLVNIRKNDAALTNSDGRFDITVGGTSPATAQVAALVNATANDRFQVFAYQNSGSAKTVRATLTVQELPFD